MHYMVYFFTCDGPTEMHGVQQKLINEDMGIKR